MRRLFANILSNWALLAMSMVVGFIMLPVLIGRLGAEAYGILVLANTLAGYTNLLRAGLGGAVVQRVAKARGEDDPESASAAAGGVFSLYLLLGLLALVVGSGIAIMLPRWFDIPVEMADSSRRFALLTAMLVAIQFPGSIFNGILHGLERYDRANLSSGLALIARTVGILIWVHAPDDLLRLGWIQIVASVGEILLSVLLVKLTWPQLRVVWRSPADPASRSAGRFGLKNLVLSGAERLIYDTDTVVVGGALGTGPVTTYSVGSNLARYARLLLGEVTRALGPTMSRLEAAGARAEQREIFLLMTRLTLFLAMPVVALGCALADDLVILWVGAGYGDSIVVLRLLLAPLIFTAPQGVAVSLLWGMGRLKIPVFVYSAEALANLGLSIWLVGGMGLPGVALGTLLPVVLLNSFWLPRAALRSLDLGFMDLWRKALLRPCLLAVPLAALSYIAWGLEPQSWAALIGALLGGSTIYASLIPWLGIGRDERATLRRLWAERSGADIGLDS